jgi:hypothetical protein
MSGAVRRRLRLQTAMHLLSNLILGWRVDPDPRTILPFVLVRSFNIEPVGFDSWASAVSEIGPILRAWFRLRFPFLNRALKLRIHNVDFEYSILQGTQEGSPVSSKTKPCRRRGQTRIPERFCSYMPPPADTMYVSFPAETRQPAERRLLTCD